MEEVIVPITEEVSVSSHFINALAAMAFPDYDELDIIIEETLAEACDELYFGIDVPLDKRLDAIDKLYFQKLWNTILMKGNDDYV